MSKTKPLREKHNCSDTFILALNDTMNVLRGKWKLPILGALLFGKKRFTDIQRSIPRITPRMLSKELRDLEMNGIINRKVYDTIPVTIEYELTSSGKSIRDVIDAMFEWGLKHRELNLSQKP
jgi:DNA-binding HxlR family transcriptional regulator